MSPTLQLIIVVLIIAAAVATAIIKATRTINHTKKSAPCDRHSDCGCHCSNCPSAQTKPFKK